MEEYSYKDYERQNEEIEAEQKRVSLVCEIENTMDVLKNYNPNNEVVQRKAKKIAERFPKIRRVRGDGSCFFRCYVFGILEYLITSKDAEEGRRFLEVVKGIVPRLVKRGIAEYLVEDFGLTFVEVVEKVVSGKFSLEDLMKTMNDEMTSNAIIFLARSLTSSHLRENRKELEPFAPFGMYDKFVREIEMMKKDCESLHITAITKEMKFDIEVVYLNFSNEDISSVKFYNNPKLFILYRPGHYDMLYTK